MPDTWIQPLNVRRFLLRKVSLKESPQDISAPVTEQGEPGTLARNHAADEQQGQIKQTKEETHCTK